ncbi:MAG TPA: hypothetical protein PLV53_13515 [Anaerolineaceae bacterium]|nr:hypothetical protein [Anaerolineaceae bacterium]
MSLPGQLPQPRSILFVCTANQIRSPIAAALLQQALQAAGQHLDGWRVESAGTWAAKGRPPQPEAIRAMKRRGLDISAHRSRTLDASLLSAFRLILTMEPGQKEAIQVEFPGIASRVFLLSEMAGESKPVVDPIGKSPDEYEKTAKEIERLLHAGWNTIFQKAASGD